MSVLNRYLPSRSWLELQNATLGMFVGWPSRETAILRDRSPGKSPESKGCLSQVSDDPPREGAKTAIILVFALIARSRADL